MKDFFCFLFALALIFVCPIQTNAQKTIGELSHGYQTMGDSILINYLGEEYVKAHFKIDSSQFRIYDYNHLGYVTYGLYHNPATILHDSVECTLCYNFFPDKKYGTQIIRFDFKNSKLVYLDTFIINRLKLDKSKPLISDSLIEDLALKELNLNPDEFVCSINVGSRIWPDYYYTKWRRHSQGFKHKKRHRRSLWHRQKKKTFNHGLLIKISRPVESKWYYPSGNKMIHHKYIIVDAYTGEIIEKGMRKKIRYGENRIRAYRSDRNFK